MKIVIDLERCIMAGECVYNHPAVFAFGDDGLPTVVAADVADDGARLSAEQAIAVCPSGAISLTGR